MAPLLVAYTLWVLRRAHQAGLERLYFVSRDGEILIALARLLASRLCLDIDLRYLYGSRLAWNGAVSSPEEAPWIWESLMWRGAKGVSNRKLLKRPGLTPDEIATLIDVTSLTERDLESSLRNPLRTALKHPEAAPLLEAARQRLRGRLTEYLAQEGALDARPIGFVDIGWRATQHDVLNIVREDAGVGLARGYFIGLMATPSPFSETREAYIADIGARLGDQVFGVGTAPPLFPLVETVCASTSGSVEGYTCQDGRVEPVLGPSDAGYLSAWGLPRVHDLVLSVAQHLLITPDLLSPSADLRPMLRELFYTFWESPSREEAEAWGAFPWESGQSGDEAMAELAPPLHLRAVATSALAQPSLLRHPGRWLLQVTASNWPAASLARSGAPARWVYGGGPALLSALRPKALRRTLGRVRRALRGG